MSFSPLDKSNRSPLNSSADRSEWIGWRVGDPLRARTNPKRLTWASWDSKQSLPCPEGPRCWFSEYKTSESMERASLWESFKVSSFCLSCTVANIPHMQFDKPNMTAAVSVQEAKLYDRQIRLWGLQAQSRQVYFLRWMAPYGQNPERSCFGGGLQRPVAGTLEKHCIGRHWIRPDSRWKECDGGGRCLQLLLERPWYWIQGKSVMMVEIMTFVGEMCWKWDCKICITKYLEWCSAWIFIAHWLFGSTRSLESSRQSHWNWQGIEFIKL